MKTEHSKENDKFIEITQKAIKKFRESLLDISNRNNLINLNFNLILFSKFQLKLKHRKPC